ncbi:MAG: hypothetical protein Q8J68_01030 [Methanolobus sp.]|uniref:hypothetical protein n=1 Tax=Methanolobus sp. TaxID=1874737 RepID=UPI00272F1917|nr:hypothetical protein [Methanolobus sp.]MDP2215868.1 hypothetical protein [Methanolobus sp.]
MKLPTPIKHALIEATISMYTEIYPSSRISKEPLTFAIPLVKILEDTERFGITDSDIQATVAENPDSLSCINPDSIQFIPPFIRICNLYDKVLYSIKTNTSVDPKTTIFYDPAIKEDLIYHFFTGSIVLMVPEDMSDLSQLKFALTAGGSKLRAIIDITGGWVYLFPKYIMQSLECGKILARDTNVDQVLARYLDEMFPEETL